MQLSHHILKEMIEEINPMWINDDLTHLPKVAILLKQYCSLNDISEKDLEEMCILWKKNMTKKKR